MNVTLFTVPLYKVRAHNYVTKDDVLTNGMVQEWAKTMDQVTLNWFPAFKEVVVANYNMVDVKTPGEAWASHPVPSTYASFNCLINPAKEKAFELTSNPCFGKFTWYERI